MNTNKLRSTETESDGKRVQKRTLPPENKDPSHRWLGEILAWSTWQLNALAGDRGSRGAPRGGFGDHVRGSLHSGTEREATRCRAEIGIVTELGAATRQRQRPSRRGPDAAKFSAHRDAPPPPSQAHGIAAGARVAGSARNGTSQWRKSDKIRGFKSL